MPDRKHLNCQFQCGKFLFMKKCFEFETQSLYGHWPMAIQLWNISLNLQVFSCIFNCSRLPFDWKGPFAYLFAIYLEFMTMFLPIQYIGCFTLFAFSSFLIGICFAKDMENDIRSIAKNIKEKSRQATSTAMYKRVTRMVHFTNEKRWASLLTSWAHTK